MLRVLNLKTRTRRLEKHQRVRCRRQRRECFDALGGDNLTLPRHATLWLGLGLGLCSGLGLGLGLGKT